MVKSLTPSAQPKIRKLVAFLLDLLYPPRCGGCDERGTLYCDYCLASVKLADSTTHSVPRIDVLISAGAFGGPLRSAVHKLKYESDTPLARPLAQLIARALEQDPRWIDDDGTPPTLIPVPLHPGKKRARGYNQSELIAAELSRITGWEINCELVRIRATQSQVGLQPDERVENVRAAFQWQGETPPSGIILIDDVCTTGSTLSECAFALISAGANNVCAATVARALPFNSSSDL